MENIESSRKEFDFLRENIKFAYATLDNIQQEIKNANEELSDSLLLIEDQASPIDSQAFWRAYLQDLKKAEQEVLDIIDALTNKHLIPKQRIKKAWEKINTPEAMARRYPKIEIQVNVLQQKINNLINILTEPLINTLIEPLGSLISYFFTEEEESALDFNEYPVVRNLTREQMNSLEALDASLKDQYGITPQSTLIQEESSVESRERMTSTTSETQTDTDGYGTDTEPMVVSNSNWDEILRRWSIRSETQGSEQEELEQEELEQEESEQEESEQEESEQEELEQEESGVLPNQTREDEFEDASETSDAEDSETCSLPQAWAIKLGYIYNNIMEKGNGRWTGGLGSDKIKKLNNIINTLNGLTEEIFEEKKAVILELIKAVCSEKRHSYHLFSKPHSAGEFEQLFRDEIIENEPRAIALDKTTRDVLLNDNMTVEDFTQLIETLATQGRSVIELT